MTRSGTAKPRWLVLFGLPFFAIGVGFGIYLAATLWKAAATRSWVPVDMTILETKLERHSSSDSGTSYRVRACYAYTYLGQAYTNDAVSLFGGSDNIGSFHQDAHRELEARRRSGRPFTGYVNPQRPAESLLYRNLRWGLVAFMGVFALVFGGTGAGVIVAGVWGGRSTRRVRALREAHPAEPWRWREDWASGRIRSSSRAQLIAATVFALFWNAISFPAAFAFRGEWQRTHNRLLWLVFLFPAIGIVLAAWAVREIARWRKYGESVFQMVPLPGVLGGKVSGVIHTPTQLRPAEGFRVRLACLRIFVTGSGKNRSVHERVLWEDEHVTRRDLLAHDFTRSAVPVLFHAPFDQPASNDEDPSDRIVWRLAVSARTPGVDYAARFEVPVFKTADSRPDEPAPAEERSVYDEQPDAVRVLTAARVGVRPGAGGSVTYHLPMARQVGPAIVTTLFTAVWCGITVALAFHAPLLFPIVFGFFGLLMAYATLALWFTSYTLTVGQGRLTVSGGWFGVGPIRVFNAVEIASISLKRKGAYGSRPLYDLRIQPGGGGRAVAAARLLDYRTATVLAGELNRALGLHGSKTGVSSEDSE